MTRLDISFASDDGVDLRGWLVLPAERGAALPGIVMTHGFSATKEMGLPGHAELLAASGYAVLLYDHRSLGQSGGEPRRLVDPFVQARDMMTAVGWLADRPEIDAARIGLWGTSYSGGEAIILAAIDRRIRAVATIVPMVAWPVPAAGPDGAAYAALEDRVRRATPDAAATTGPHAVVPAPDTSLRALMPDPATTEWMLREAAQAGGRWRNEVLTPDWSGVPFDPQIALPHLHAPLLMIVGDADRVTPAALARKAAAQAGGKAELIEMAGHHCTFYAGEPRRAAAAAIIEFYGRTL